MDNYWREGVHAVSLSELCRRASLSKPALYREFINEDGLMEAALEHYRQLAIVPLLSFMTTEQPFGSMLDLIIDGMTAERDVPAGCLFTQMRLETHRLGPQTAARIRTIEEERLAAFEVWYGRAVESGGADPNLSPAFAARYLDTQLGAVLLQMGAGAPPGQVRAEAKLALSVLLR